MGTYSRNSRKKWGRKGAESLRKHVNPRGDAEKDRCMGYEVLGIDGY